MSSQFLRTYVSEINEWSSLNFGDNSSKLMEYSVRIPVALDSLAPLMGLVEELGEFAEVYGTFELNKPAVEDALADFYIFFCDYLARENSPFALTDPDKLDEMCTGYRMRYKDPLKSLFIPISKLYHCTLKAHQGIRKFVDRGYYHRMRDSLCAEIYCTLNRISMDFFSQKIEELAFDTWKDIVNKRDWNKNPEAGI